MTDRTKPSRDIAEAEYQLYQELGRPNGPYHLKCFECDEIFDPIATLFEANTAIRRHTGYHGGWKEENAQVVLTDSCGKEIMRFHAIHKADQYEELTCRTCRAELPEDRVSCPECGHIPTEERLA